jgi:hypothetical protein
MFTKKTHPLVQGKPIRFRFFQQLGWTGVAAFFGVGFIAGLYWLGLQQHYPFLPGTGSAKLWWDSGMGIIHSPMWPAYRHGVRDNGEPETWALVGGVLLGAASVNAKRIPLKLVPVAALVLLAFIVAFATGITWVTDFGPLKNWSDIFSWQQLLLGVIAGRILHYMWKPVGASIRYHMVTSSLRKGIVPLWVTLPLRPPAWRELWQQLKDAGTIKVETTAQAEKHRAVRVMTSLGIFLFVVIAIVGILAKYAVGHGISIPGMTS